MRVIRENPVGALLGEEEIEAVRRVLESGDSLSRGPDIELFEKEFAAYCGAKHAVAVSSCGAALNLAAQVLNLTEKDEVIVQANSFWATFVELLRRNVSIRCADVDRNSLNINPEKIEPLITPRTRAIFLVHHGGNPADLDPIRQLATKYGLTVVEDCAHAVGAEYKGKRIGFGSEIACFSFSTLKNMTTLGEGGMIVTDHSAYAEMAWGLRTNFPFGVKVKREVPDLGRYVKPKSVGFMHAGDAWDFDWVSVSEIGTAYRMSTPQAAVGRVQLKKLDGFIRRRAEIALRYNEAVRKFPQLREVKVPPGSRHAWHLYSFFLNLEAGLNRDDLIDQLSRVHDIEIVNRYWPIHLGGIMRMRGHNVGECPDCEGVWFREQIDLPISPRMETSDVEAVAKAVEDSMQTLLKGNGSSRLGG